MIINSALREIRLFVSSTFRDFVQERNQLVTDAFPRLRQECTERGVAFTEIDLRWGITDDEAREYRVLQICIEEVERCSHFPPFFVGILGDRYGWVPEAKDWDNAASIEAIMPGFADRHKGKSITELEIQCGVFQREEMLEHSFFYFRKANGPRDERQERLKQLIRSSGANYREQIPTPEELSGLIVHDLTEAIEKRYPKKQRPSWIEQISLAQELHTADLAISYIPSPSLYKEWLGDIESGNSICLFGESGSGKSAFLATLPDAVNELRPHSHVYKHHVGVGDSRTRFAWMACLFLWARERGLTQLELPTSNAEIQAQLPILLNAFPVSDLVIIIIDAIDQLDDGSSIDEWLPAHTPANIHWIASTTNTQQMMACRHRGWQVRRLPPLNPDCAKQLVSAGLSRYRKTLPEKMLLRCLQHSMSSSPLFLKVLYEELRLQGNHEALDGNLNDLLECASIQALFEAMLRRVERNVGASAVDVLAIIGLSKHGASEPEIRACLDLRTWDVRRVILLVTPYLSSHQGLLSPFHEGFRKALSTQPNVTELKERWRSYWRQSLDVHRRFEEYPSALAYLDEWGAITNWIFSEHTLAYAWECKNIEALVNWHAQIVSHVAGIQAVVSSDIERWPLSALQGLREFAYQVGNRDLEMMALMAQQGGDKMNNCAWLIDRSIIHYRRGQQTEATDLAHQAVGVAKSPREELDSAMNLVQMLAFGSDPGKALQICRQISLDRIELLNSDIEAQAYLCHVTSLACHFLDLNAESCAQSNRAADLYGALGRRYDQGISWVNAGDGAWGAGQYDQSERHFQKAMDLSSVCRLPHVEDIAKICLANLRMSQMRLGEAVVLYEEGISLANRIGQEWDVLYGRIYRALTLGILGRANEDLSKLALDATSGGYCYLSDIALAYQLVLADGQDFSWRSLANSPFPGPRAYALASGILQGQDLVQDLTQLLDTTEGIKGPFDFIEKALAKNIRTR